jgi:hypothetical protein
VIRYLPDQRRKIVIRGQHRLVDGQPVQVIESTTRPKRDIAPETPVRLSNTAP